MRILHINYNYLGTALHDVMISHMNSRLPDNAVFAPSWRESDKSFEKNVKVVKCFKKCDRAFFHIKQRKIINAAEQNFDISKFDFIHAYTVFSDGNCAYKLSQKYHIPYAVAVRDTDVNSFFKWMIHLRKLGIKILNNASVVFFLSTTYRDYVLEHYIPQEYHESILKKSHIVPNGIDDFWLNNIGKSRDLSDFQSIRVIYAGRINKRKNLMKTVAAIKLLISQGYNVSYDVVGKIEDQVLYEKIIGEQFVTYHKPCSKEGLIQLYRKADIFVMPSLTETFGLVYAEAMSQGLPVLYSKEQGFDGQFEEGVVGFSVDKNDPEDIARKTIQVMERYSEISHNCIEKVGKFNWNAIIESYINIYHGIVSGNQCF